MPVNYLTGQALLVINSGSSTVKFALYRPVLPLQVLFRGEIEGIGADVRFHIRNADEQTVVEQSISASDHEQTLSLLLDWVKKEASALEIVAAGHRVVHGGVRYQAPVLIDDNVMVYLESLVPLAPNHQPGSLRGIDALRRLQPDLAQVACFDTAFHHDQPEVERRFALPDRPELEDVCRYGFHGLSYEYIASVLPQYLGERANGKIIVAHLGHGASLCALHRRRSVATTMTFTPLDGIPMGTRCGSIDPAVVLYLLQQGMNAESISDLLYFHSGLLGVSGATDDMAGLLKLATPRSRLAIDYFIHHSVRAVGSLAAALEGLDAVIFTGGIGEHATAIREAICRRCEWLGIDLDETANRRGQACISRAGSPVQAWIIPTDEELMLAEHTLSLHPRSSARD